MSGDGRVIIGAFSSKSYRDRGKLIRYDWMDDRVTDLWAGFSKIFGVVSDIRAEKIAFIRQGGEITLLHAVPGTDVAPAQIGSFSYMKADFDMAIDAIGSHLLIADNELLFQKVRSNVAAEINDYKPQNTVRRVDITADGSRCVEISKKCITVRSLHTEKIIAYLHHKSRSRCIVQIAVSISPDGSTILAAGAQGQLLLWKLQSPQFKQTSTNLQEIHPRYADTQLSDVPSCLVHNYSIQQYSLSPVTPVASTGIELAPESPQTGLYSHIKLSQ